MTSLSPNDPDPEPLESMRRMAYDRSKWLQTCTYEITKYQYNKEELNQFYDQLEDVIGRVKKRFNCNLCGGFPKKTLVLPCGCKYCSKCAARSWNKAKQVTCPKCKTISEAPAIPFYAMDAVVTDMNIFLKEMKYFKSPNFNAAKSDDSEETLKRLKSMNFVLLQRLKNIESQLMCDYCFNRIQKTFLVKCAADTFSFRPFCKGCDQKYIRFYENEQGKVFQPSFEFQSFDPIVGEFYEFMDNIVDYSKTSKVPARFLGSNGGISFAPIYKMLVGIVIMGLVLMYYSS